MRFFISAGLFRRGARMSLLLSPFLVVLGALFIYSRGSQATPTLSLSRTRVYGPAIHPKRCSLPINYFYIQAVDTDGNKYATIT